MPEGLPNDSELIRAARQGRVWAMEALYGRYFPLVWRYVFRRVGGDWPSAEDVVGEVFLAAVREVAHLDADRSVIGAWLIGIARHKLGDFHRRQARRREVVDSSSMSEVDGRTSEVSVREVEIRDAVLWAMDRLSDEQRLALEWQVVDGLSVRRIGERLDRSDKAVESILYRARKLMRGLLTARLGGGHDWGA